MGRCSPPQCGKGDESLAVSEKIRNLDSIRDIAELRKLVIILFGNQFMDTGNQFY
jgi:hypothetical protein